MAVDFSEQGNTNAGVIAAMTIANVIGSEESELAEALLANPKLGVLHYVVDALRNAIADQAYAGINHSVYSLMQTLGHLSVPDKNKDRIVVSGALELIPMVLKRSTIDGNPQLTSLAKESAVFVIWQLAFKDHLRPLLLSTDILDCLRDLNTQSPSPKLRQNIDGVLFTLEEKQKSSVNTSLRDSSVSLSLTSSSSSSSSSSSPSSSSSSSLSSSVAAAAAPVPVPESGPLYDVMISYSWKWQDLAKRLHQSLKDAGFSVWIDIEFMQGSTLGAMADAIETSHCILMLMAQEYKDSANCRLEVQWR
jgi:hypothetical protein